MNPLADALVAPLFGRTDAVLIGSDGSTVSGDALYRESGQIANVLTEAGVLPGDRVAMPAEKSVQALALYLACLRIGALFLPLNTAYTSAELDYFLGDAEPRVMVCDPVDASALSPMTRAKGITLLTLDASGSGSLAELTAAAPHEFTSVKRGPDDLAAILYTSGTTGRSTGLSPFCKLDLLAARARGTVNAAGARFSALPYSRKTGHSCKTQRDQLGELTVCGCVFNEWSQHFDLLRKMECSA